MCQSTTMSERLQKKNSEQTASTKLTSSQVASPAKMCHAPALEKALKTAMGKLLAADCGESTQGSLANLDHDGSWLKMSEGCCQQVLISDREETSELFSGTWPTWGMMRFGRVTVLKPLARRTKEKECSSWRTPDANLGARGPKQAEMYEECKKTNKHALNLLDQVKHECNWPTPTANEDAAGTANGKMQKMLGNNEQIRNSGQGTLNADWVEILMGLPIGWTDIDCEEPQPWPGWPAPMNAGMWRTPMAGNPTKNGRNEPNLPEQAKIEESGQYPYEPPRVVVGQKNRAKRLKALGNGCVPQQVYFVFAAIVEVENEA